MRYFVALANEGSMSKAAHSLHLSQPTLSRQLGLLERDLGKQLYIRKANHMHLTQAGHTLLQYAEKIVELADKAEAELSSTDDHVSGHVLVGTAETDALEFVADCVNELYRNHPNVIIDFVSGSPLEMYERLDAGIIDFLISVNNPPRAGFNTLPFPGCNSWVVVMSSDAPLANCEYITPQNLVGERIICSRLVLKSGQLQTWAGELADSFIVSTTFNLGAYITNVLAAHGVGYLFTYQELNEIVSDERTIAIPMKPAFPIDETVLVWKRNRILSPACNCFLEQVKKAITNNTEALEQ